MYLWCDWDAFKDDGHSCAVHHSHIILSFGFCSNVRSFHLRNRAASFNAKMCQALHSVVGSVIDPPTFVLSNAFNVLQTYVHCTYKKRKNLNKNSLRCHGRTDLVKIKPVI